MSQPSHALQGEVIARPEEELTAPHQTAIEQRHLGAVEQVDEACRLAYGETMDALPASFDYSDEQLAKRYQRSIAECLQEVNQRADLTAAEKQSVAAGVASWVGEHPVEDLLQAFQNSADFTSYTGYAGDFGWSRSGIRTAFRNIARNATARLEGAQTNGNQSLLDLERSHASHTVYAGRTQPRRLGTVAIRLTPAQRSDKERYEHYLGKLKETPQQAAAIDEKHETKIAEIESSMTHQLEALRATILAQPGEDIRLVALREKIEMLRGAINGQLQRIDRERRLKKASSRLFEDALNSVFGTDSVRSTGQTGGQYSRPKPRLQGPDYRAATRRPPTAQELARTQGEVWIERHFPHTLKGEDRKAAYRRLAKEVHPDLEPPEDLSREQAKAAMNHLNGLNSRRQKFEQQQR